jgi:hypothetical protein
MHGAQDRSLETTRNAGFGEVVMVATTTQTVHESDVFKTKISVNVFPEIFR